MISPKIEKLRIKLDKASFKYKRTYKFSEPNSKIKKKQKRNS